MKKISLVLMILFVVSPSWALFCQFCGQDIPVTSKFCLSCGKQVKDAGSEEKPGSDHGVQSAQSVPIDESFLKNYEPIEKIEMLLSTTNYSSVVTLATEYRQRMTLNFQKIEPKLSDYSPARKKLHSIYLRKFDILERYLDAWNRHSNGPKKGQGGAQKEKLLFELARTNDMIGALKDSKNDSGVLSKIEGMERDLDKSIKEFVVTSPYLAVENRRITKNQPIWIIEEKAGLVKVLHMGETDLSMPISGWVPQYDLEKRTTWKSENPPSIVYHTYQPPTQVIFVERDSWGWNHHRRYPFGYRRSSRWKFGGGCW